MCLCGSEYDGYARSPQDVSHLMDGYGLVLRCVAHQPYVGVMKLLDGLLYGLDILERIQAADIGDIKCLGWYILGVKLLWVVAVVDKMHVGVQVLQEIHMPW